MHAFRMPTLRHDIYIYASRKWAGVNGHGSDGIQQKEAPTGVIVGTAKVSKCVRVNGHDSEDLREGETPTGVIVGTAVISKCRRENGHYEWHLSGVRRMKKPRKPKGQPKPVWFRPF